MNSTYGEADSILTFEARNAQGQVIGTSDSVHLFRFTSVVIAIGGFNQKTADYTDYRNGVFRLGYELYTQDAYDVHIYAHGDVGDGGAGAAYNEAVNAIMQRHVTKVSVFGFSMGGGATRDLLSRLEFDYESCVLGDFTVPFTAYIDAVLNGSVLLRSPVQTKPALTQSHWNYYEQLYSYNPQGVEIPGAMNIFVNGNPWGFNLSHTTIDDDRDLTNMESRTHVLQSIRRRVNMSVAR